jgi:hypothetical protein
MTGACYNEKRQYRTQPFSWRPCHLYYLYLRNNFAFDFRIYGRLAINITVLSLKLGRRNDVENRSGGSHRLYDTCTRDCISQVIYPHDAANHNPVSTVKAKEE